MKKRAALTAFLAVLHFSLLGLATVIGQTTSADLLAFTIDEQRIPCGAAVRPFNIAIMDIGHHLLCNLTGMEGHAIFAGWSPDGTRVAIEAGGTVYIADSHMREVARFEQSYSPSWSVNGTLVFENIVGNIFTVDRNGNNRQFLTSDGITGTRPRWSPDGRSVVFECQLDMCIVDSSGKNLRQLPLSSETTTMDGGSSDSGDMLVIYHGSMYWVDFNGQQMQRIVIDFDIYLSSWSFDGRYMALLTNGDAGIYSITVVNIANGSEQHLFSDAPSSFSLYANMAWSSDSNQLAFQFNSDTYLANIPTGHVRLICTNCSNPVWVSDPALYAMIIEP